MSLCRLVAMLPLLATVVSGVTVFSAPNTTVESFFRLGLSLQFPTTLDALNNNKNVMLEQLKAYAENLSPNSIEKVLVSGVHAKTTDPVSSMTSVNYDIVFDLYTIQSVHNPSEYNATMSRFYYLRNYLFVDAFLSDALTASMFYMIINPPENNRVQIYQFQASPYVVAPAPLQAPFIRLDVPIMYGSNWSFQIDAFFFQRVQYAVAEYFRGKEITAAWVRAESATPVGNYFVVHIFVGLPALNTYLHRASLSNHVQTVADQTTLSNENLPTLTEKVQSNFGSDYSLATNEVVVDLFADGATFDSEWLSSAIEMKRVMNPTPLHFMFVYVYTRASTRVNFTNFNEDTLALESAIVTMSNISHYGLHSCAVESIYKAANSRLLQWKVVLPLNDDHATQTNRWLLKNIFQMSLASAESLSHWRFQPITSIEVGLYPDGYTPLPVSVSDDLYRKRSIYPLEPADMNAYVNVNDPDPRCQSSFCILLSFTNHMLNQPFVLSSYETKAQVFSNAFHPGATAPVIIPHSSEQDTTSWQIWPTATDTGSNPLTLDIVMHFTPPTSFHETFDDFTLRIMGAYVISCRHIVVSKASTPRRCVCVCVPVCVGLLRMSLVMVTYSGFVVVV
jgi:hypothetical protein